MFCAAGVVALTEKSSAKCPPEIRQPAPALPTNVQVGLFIESSSVGVNSIAGRRSALAHVALKVRPSDAKICLAFMIPSNVTVTGSASLPWKEFDGQQPF